MVVAAGGVETAPTGRRRVPVWASLLTLVCCASSIGALLADVYGLLEMSTFARLFTGPGLVGLVVLGTAPIPGLEELRRRIRVGAVAGVVGTLAYDLFRVPFVVAGMRMFAPIDSYGLLIDGGSMASPVTNTIGWMFHLSNGVTFGIAYCTVAARRHWGWGALWGLTLETAVIVTPFRTRYALTETVPIILAYYAHVPYGYAVGRMSQRFDQVEDTLSPLVRPVTVTIGAAVLAIVVWLQPWSTPSSIREAERVAAETGQPAVVVDTDAFSPEWVRVEAGGCLVVVNRSESDFETEFGAVEAGARSQLCFTEPGVERVHLGTRAYAGGFVYVRG